MKFTVTCLFIFITLQSSAQKDSTFLPKLTVKFAPVGLKAGNIVLQGEYNFGGKQSLTVKLGLPNNTSHTFTYDGYDAPFDMKAMSFLAGYRMYFSKTRTMRGLYWEPFFHYLHHSSEGLSEATF